MADATDPDPDLDFDRDVELELELDLDPERTLARFRHPLAWLGWLVPVLPFIAIVVADYVNNQGHLHENAAQVCAEAPTCEGEVADIAFASAPYTQRNRGLGNLIVYRRSPDCAHAVEAYYQFGGSLSFQGSADDPDPVARARFLAEREEWSSRYVIRERVPCSKVDDL